jgi:hypothetical protein
VSRKVHDGIDVVVVEYLVEKNRITGITDDEVTRRDCSFKACRQVIERNDCLARETELSYNVATDIAGAAGDQYLAVFHKIFTNPIVVMEKL